jgi:predicted Zn finger-like uncharacterized protein
MTIKVICPACDASYTLSDDKAGKEVRCRRCNDVISVPDPEEDRLERRIRKSEGSSGFSPLFWILGITGAVCVVLFCGAAIAIGLVAYGVASVAKQVSADMEQAATEMPGAVPKDIDEAIRWLGQPGYKPENAAVWLGRQPVNQARHAEVVVALDRAYQAPGINVLARDRILDALAAWAGPGDVPLLVKSLDSGSNPAGQANQRVVDALVKFKDPRGAEALAARLGSLDHFKAKDALEKMGPVAEDALGGVLLSSGNVTAKITALQILQQVGTKKSVPIVQQAMERDQGIKWQAENTIKAIQKR